MPENIIFVGNNKKIAGFISGNIFTVLAILTIIFYRGFFDTNDDPYMESSLNGTFVFDQSSPFLMYANSLLGYFLHWLYSLAPKVSWYFWLLKLPIIILVAQNNRIFHKISMGFFRKILPGYFIISLFVILLTVYYLSFLQFTIASFVLIFSGTLAYFKKKYFLSFVCFFIAILLRGYTSVVAFAVIFPVLLLYFTKGKKIGALIKDTFLFGISFLILLFTLNKADNYFEKNADKGLKNVIFSRGLILDYHYYEHVDNDVLKDIKKNYGWTYNDFLMMSLFFNDHQKFSNENMVAVADQLIRNYKPNLWFYKPGAWIWMASNWLNPVALIVLFLIIARVFQVRFSKKSFQKILLILLPFLFANFILIFVSNFTKNAPFRLYFGIQVFLMFYYLFTIFRNGNAESIFHRYFRWFFSMLILVFAFMTLQTITRKFSDRKMLISDLETIKTQIEVSDKVVLPIGTHVYFRHFRPGEFRKHIDGFWFVEGKNVASSESLSNRNKVDCIDLHLCSVNSDMFIYFCPLGTYADICAVYPVFFMENYGIDVELKIVYSGNKVRVFKVISKDYNLTF